MQSLGGGVTDVDGLGSNVPPKTGTVIVPRNALASKLSTLHNMNTTHEFYWLLHHGELLEVLTEPVENRINYIIANKPPHEIPIRLTWLCKVKTPERLPISLLKADAARQKTYADCRKTYADCRKTDADLRRADADLQRAYADLQRAYADLQRAYADLQRAYADHWPEIVMLHKEECPGCPFDYEGTRELIFS